MKIIIPIIILSISIVTPGKAQTEDDYFKTETSYDSIHSSIVYCRVWENDSLGLYLKRCYYETTNNIAYEYTRINNVQHGTLIIYYPNGVISSVRNFCFGKEVGPSVEFYSNSKLKMIGNIKSDSIIKIRNKNIIIQYDTNTWTIVKSEHISYGEKSGIWTYYYNSGKIERVETYLNGNKDGVWKYYNENGVLVKTELYRNGELIKTEEHSYK